MKFRDGFSPRVNALSMLASIMERSGGPEQVILTDGETTIKRFGQYEKVTYKGKEEIIGLIDPVLVYLGNEFSDFTLKDIAARTMKYWNTMPKYQLNFAGKRLLVLPSPKRVLTSNELEKINRFLEGTARRLFISCGTDTDIFNLVLDQLESIFEIIPFATSQDAMMSGILSTGELIALPVTTRGWFKVRDKYADLATIKDPFDKGLAFSNVISVSPAYTYPAGTGTVWETDDVYSTEFQGLADIHYGGAGWGCFRNNLYPVSYDLDDWTAISKADFMAWLTSIETYFPLITKVPAGHTLTRNSKGWLDFTDVALFDFIAAQLVYKSGDNVLVGGFLPAWLTTAYNTSYDPNYAIKRFSEWCVYEEWGTEDKLSQMFFNMPPYLYSDDTYIPPIQS